MKKHIRQLIADAPRGKLRKLPLGVKHYTKAELSQRLVSGQPLSPEQLQRLFSEREIRETRIETSARKQFLDRMQARFRGTTSEETTNAQQS